jgi:hypothetical protein
MMVEVVFFVFEVLLNFFMKDSISHGVVKLGDLFFIGIVAEYVAFLCGVISFKIITDLAVYILQFGSSFH